MRVTNPLYWILDASSGSHGRLTITTCTTEYCERAVFEAAICRQEDLRYTLLGVVALTAN